jgi:methionine synthase I (cobalamin-dependent)
MASRILVLDGGMGTVLFSHQLTAADYGGSLVLCYSHFRALRRFE